MDKPQKHIIFVAGEASGDLHAAHLIAQLKKANPSLHFSGLGGPKMGAQGVTLHEDLTKKAVVGFIEVLRHLNYFRKIFKLILGKIDETNPDLIVLIDYPGFNLRLAKELKRRGKKIIYYISPQVWAWKENRVEIIRRCVDRMLVLFKFEEEFYKQHGIQVDFVGHPLKDSITISTTRDQFLQSLGLPLHKLTIGILPGSRPKEIERMLPIMLEAAKILSKKFPKLQFLLMQAPTISKKALQKHFPPYPLPITIVNDKTYDGINACDLCMVTSGTATLETAILQKPMVIVYKTAVLTWALAKMLIKIPHIGMINVMAKKRIVPECVQWHATSEQIALELEKMFTDEIRLAQIKADIKNTVDALGESGAASKAAKIILEELNKH